MKKLVLILLVAKSIVSFGSDSSTVGLFTGETNSFFKKECSINSQIVEKPSHRFGTIIDYDFIVKGNKEEISFSASNESVIDAITMGELSTSNGSDTSGEVLEVVLDSVGTPLSFKVVRYFTLFGFTKKTELIDCVNLNK